MNLQVTQRGSCDTVIYEALQGEWCETKTGRGNARENCEGGFPLNNTGIMLLFFLDGCNKLN